MATKRKAQMATQVDELVDQVLKKARGAGTRQIAVWKKPADEVRQLVRKDYVRSVRQYLEYSQLKSLLASFDQFLPGFNRVPIGMMSVKTFARMAVDLKIHFNATPWEGEDGLALRGFYVDQMDGMLKRPLIYVNTAHHPLAVSTTFCHELGHHFGNRLFESVDQPVHFFFDADYAAHLSEPGELAADIMVSLAGYPEPIARKIFEAPWDWGLVARAKNLTEAALNEVRVHLRRVYGFDLMEHIPPDKRLHHLAGMIHYAKLRWAILAEYDL